MRKRRPLAAVHVIVTGYQTATVSKSKKFVGTTFGNILLGGIVGVEAGASIRANYEYLNRNTLSNRPRSCARPQRI